MRYTVIILTISIFMSLEVLSQSKKFDGIKKVFVYKDSNGYQDVIIFFSEKDSLQKGVYMGVELSEDSVPVYYRSEFVSRKLGEYDVTFELKDFYYSKVPFYTTTTNQDYLPEDSKVPYILQANINYLGDYSGDKLKITRITNRHLFSSADTMIFSESELVSD